MHKVIRLPAPHPSFRPRLEAGMRRPGHPGTAVRIGEHLYEVVSAETSGEKWIYRLEPWPDAEAIRVYVEWGEGSEGEFVDGLRRTRLRARGRALSWAAQPFLGFLPAQYQERLHESKGLDPVRATFWSAALETAVALPIALLFLVGSLTGGVRRLTGPIPGWVGFLCAVAAAEGAFRLAAVISSGEPIGSLALALLGLRSASKDRRPVPGDEVLTAGDILDIVSGGPKPWWEEAGGLTYKGESYTLAESNRHGSRFSYRFRKGGRGYPVFDPEAENARKRSSDFSYVLAPLWGFLPSGLQRSLESYGRYRSRPFVVLSIALNLLLALGLAGSGLRSGPQGVLEVRSGLGLAIAAGLLLESCWRLLRLLVDGKTTGSLLGFLVLPVYRLTIKRFGRS